jgi:hypothetical protein
VGTLDAGSVVAGAVVSCLMCLLTGLAVGWMAGAPVGAATALACYVVIAARRDTELMQLARVWLQR